MELKPYSAETKDNFWISIGYHICKLRVDFDRIYTNIGEYNFYETSRIRQLIFYYIHPDQILSRLITYLSRVMHSLDYNNESTSHIESGDISIPIQSIFFKLAPDYTYTKLFNSIIFKRLALKYNKDFYNCIPTEIFLIFQTDSIIFKKNNRYLKQMQISADENEKRIDELENQLYLEPWSDY